jgi:glycosyltransferase involved in cell wall biosynthesis
MVSHSTRVYLFSPYCLLRPTTNRIFDMRLCDGIAGHDVSVTAVYPYAYMRDNIPASYVSKAYGLRNPVQLRRLYTPLRENSFKLWRFLVLLVAFGISTFRIFAESVRHRGRTILISRDAKSLVPAIALRKITGGLVRVTVLYVASEVKKDKPIFRWVVRNADGVLAGVSAARDAIRRLYNLPEDRFMLLLAPVPDELPVCSKSDARIKIGYTRGRPLVVYTGKLGPEVAELRYILEAAKDLPEYDFLFTGGRPSAVEAVRKYASDKGLLNVLFTGFMDDSTVIRYYQLAGDVLVSYYTAKDHMVEYNYPQKVNEYLTTGNPVVTPDFPATKDVLSERNVIFVRPDDPKDLVRGIRLAIEDKELVGRITDQALRDIKEITFRQRAEELLRFAESLPTVRSKENR